jgi:hypothetical protein
MVDRTLADWLAARRQVEPVQIVVVSEGVLDEDRFLRPKNAVEIGECIGRQEHRQRVYRFPAELGRRIDFEENQNGPQVVVRWRRKEDLMFWLGARPGSREANAPISTV